MANKKRQKIFGLTTDPYNNIYGYSLVFFKFFDYLTKNVKGMDIFLYTNNGVCSKIVKNEHFIIKKIKPNTNLLLKSGILFWFFLKNCWKINGSTTIVANSEIPELLAALVRKYRKKKVFCVLQDDRIREDNLYSKVICHIRNYLIGKIGNVLFTNRFTLSKFDTSINKFYIGNPVFNHE